MIGLHNFSLLFTPYPHIFPLLNVTSETTLFTPNRLKRSEEKSALLDSLLEAWQRLYAQEQSYLVEAVERLVVNAELSAASIKALAAVVDALRPAPDLTPRHALFFVRNKLLALYSRWATRSELSKRSSFRWWLCSFRILVGDYSGVWVKLNWIHFCHSYPF